VKRWDRFWFGFEVSGLHLAIVRFVFFGLLALDMWLQISHAPRYGAGDFNVAHLRIFDTLLPTPTRDRMLVLYAVQAYLAAAFAIGLLGRGWLVLLTTLYGYSYFSSQLDSYQHHWMMFLVLCAMCFVEWRPSRREGRELGDWALRLVLAIASLVYFWAIVTKLDPLWLDGQTVNSQIGTPWLRDVVDGWLRFRNPDPLAPWATMAVLVIVTEAALAIAIHVRLLRLPAALVGIVFHLGIEISGFKIGLFSYFMVALYLLVLPVDDIRRWLSRWFPAAEKELPARAPHQRSPLLGTVAGLMVLGGCGALLFAFPFEQRGTVALCALALGAAIVATTWFQTRESLVRIGVAHLVACLALVTFAGSTDTVRDYYRFWGGSSRRLGDVDTAKQAYERLVDVAPDYAPGHSTLGNLLSKSDPDRALRHFELAQKLAPNKAGGFIGAALLHHQAQRGKEAYEAARMAQILDPKNKQAQRILDYWRERR